MLVYTDLADKIVRDIVTRVPDLGHIDPDRIALIAAARCTGRHTGNLAACCGLRDEPRPTFSIWTLAGTRTIIGVSQWFQTVMPKVRLNGRSMYYLIQLRLPRILLSNPLQTLVHELYHIGERFDGRMRPARHGREFDREVRRLSNLWLARQHGDLARLAQLNFHQLQREFQSVLGLGVPANFKLPYFQAIEPPESYADGVARLYPGYRLAPHYRIRQVELNSVEPLTVLTDKDLVLRHYERRGSRRIPSIYLRHARNHIALSA